MGMGEWGRGPVEPLWVCPAGCAWQGPEKLRLRQVHGVKPLGDIPQSAPFDGWWAGMHLSEVLSVPIGHPARLGEQVRPALLPAVSLPPPHFCAPGPHLGGVWVGAFESSWSCSPAFLPSPTEGKLRPSM